MTGQGWLERGLAVAMIATALYCAARLAVPRWRDTGAHRGDDAVHFAMAGAMAAMLLGIAQPVWGGAAMLAFLVPAGWSARQVVTAARRAPIAWYEPMTGGLGHLQLSVAGVAMVYMSGAVPGFGTSGAEPSAGLVGGHSGHAMLAAPSLGGDGHNGGLAVAGVLLIAVLAALAVVNVGQLAASADRALLQVRSRMWPRRLTLCCQFAMAATMAHMIAAMV